MARIVVSRDLRRAAGVTTGQTLKVSAVPGRILLEVKPNSRGKIIRRGKLKMWTGPVPPPFRGGRTSPAHQR